MKKSGRLPDSSWLAAPALRAVMAALGADGAVLRLVGGCVRDALAGFAIGDIDIATSDPPETAAALLARAGLRTVPTGLEHGTITAIAAGTPYEVTTLRRDVETFGRHARVAYTDDWLEDAARRDFTINALYADLDGTYYDPFGGAADLAAGRVRFVGEARARVAEDRLRVLRFFRFHARHGRGAPDEAALAACAAEARHLGALSVERVAGELLKILAVPDPGPALALMREHGVLAHALPEGGAVERLRALIEIERSACSEGQTVAADGVRRLAALIDLPGKGAEAGARLRLSNERRARLGLIAAPPAELEARMDERAARRLLHRHGAENVVDMALIAWAGRSVAGEKNVAQASSWLSLIRLARGWTAKVLPIKGRDLAELGLAPGPGMGVALDALETWWIEEDFRPDRAAMLARARGLLDSGKN